MTVAAIIDKLGWPTLAKSLGVGRTAIVNAKTAKQFPAAWYPTVRDLCKSAGVECSEDLFSWRTSDASSDCCSAGQPNDP